MAVFSPLDPVTPEEFFVPNPALPRQLYQDVAFCLIHRAEAILRLVEPIDLEGESHHTPVTIANAAWAADGLLQQVEQVLKYAWPAAQRGN